MKYRMPAEWESHAATWIAWPHNKEHWPGKFAPIPHIYARFVKELSQSEPVFMCVNDEKTEKEATAALREAGMREQTVTSPSEKAGVKKIFRNVEFFHIPTNASWSRDHGPIFVKDEKGGIVITDWIFNAWGEKYKPWNLDDVVPQRIADQLKMPIVQPGIVMEGGSIEVNGKGTLLTTEQCLLNKNRNPKLSREQIEDYLNKYLGATHILWLREGIVGDDTDGHIDDIARFVDPITVVCAVEKNEKDENHEILKKNFEDLTHMKDQDSHPLRVIEIPMPSPVVYENQRLPASYVNFYIANTAVFMPTFQCPQDEEALAVLRRVFPNRRVVGIDCVDWIWGLGTLHCSTQQQPA